MIECLLCHSCVNLKGSVCTPCISQHSIGNFKQSRRYKYEPGDPVWYCENREFFKASIVSYNNSSLFEKGRTIIHITDTNYPFKQEAINKGVYFTSITPVNSQQEIDTVNYILAQFGVNPEFQKLSPLLGDVLIQVQFQVGDIVLFENNKWVIIEIDLSIKYSEFIYIVKKMDEVSDTPLLKTIYNPLELSKC